MKISHFKEEKVYLVSNHAVARNPIFTSKKIQLFFQNKMNEYLDPLAEVLSFNLNKHEFQIILKLRSREDFINFYKSRARYEEGEIIPESSYIFSRAMSNLQVSLVKKFNFLYKRSGTLMAGRFSRMIIENYTELQKWKRIMNNGQTIFNYSDLWVSFILDKQPPMFGESKFLIEELENELDFNGKININEGDLVGQLIEKEKSSFLHPIHFHYRHFFKCLSKYQQ